MKQTRLHISAIFRRRFSDFLLFGVTLVELVVLVVLTPGFTTADWIYVVQHLTVLGIAVARRPPETQVRSLRIMFAVGVSYTYSYAQVIYLHWMSGYPAWRICGLVLVTLSACLSFVSLVSLGKFFGVRPALRGLTTRGPYRLVRHPMYLAYILGDIGYNLEEWNFGTLLILIAGWASLLYRIRAEERILARNIRWPTYATRVPWRLIPGLW